MEPSRPQCSSQGSHDSLLTRGVHLERQEAKGLIESQSLPGLLCMGHTQTAGESQGRMWASFKQFTGAGTDSCLSLHVPGSQTVSAGL